MREPIHLAVAGHVDHGKSTLIASLLIALGAMPAEKIENLRKRCENEKRDFELAYLLDAFKDEQSQGITIEGARLRLEHAGHAFRIFDCPGHVEFLKNMLSGASQADAAILVVDAAEGMRENTKRHARFLQFLGIREWIVAINKLDLCADAESRFHEVTREFKEMIGGESTRLVFVPVIAKSGVGLVTRSSSLSWWSGPTLLEAMSNLTHAIAKENGPLRFQIQDVYLKKTTEGYERTLVGMCQSGSLRVGDPLSFLPGGSRSQVTSIETFPANEDPSLVVKAGQVGAIRIADRRHVLRGDIAVREGDGSLICGTHWRARVVWLARTPLQLHADYFVKLGTFRVRARILSIDSSWNASDVNERTDLALNVSANQMAELTFVTESPIAVDVDSELSPLNRFVFVHQYEICGAGFISRHESVGVKAIPALSLITTQDREVRNRHPGRLILMRGTREETQILEAELFAKGLQVTSFEAEEADKAEILVHHGFVVLFQADKMSSRDLESLSRKFGIDPIVENSVDQLNWSGIDCDNKVTTT